jgi:uncharacterized coiled-coil protein SlyX/transposase
MIEWRNLKKLHTAAQQHIKKQDRIIKDQVTRIILLETTVTEQAKIIQTLQLQMAELRDIVFGKKKKAAEVTADDEEEPEHPSHPRTGASYRRPIPREEEVTERKPHPIKVCTVCRTFLIKKTTRSYYEEDIPLVKKTVIQHIVERGYCKSCRRWQSAVALPAAPVVLGENVQLFITHLSTVSRLTYEQIRTLLTTRYHISLSDGEIAKILTREANQLRPEYERLKARIRSEPAAHYDETGHPVQAGGEGNYAWVMASARTQDAVFTCGRSRGKGVALELKGDADHIGISDDYNAYHATFSLHQLCWAHPYRKLRDLATTDVLAEKVRIHCRTTFTHFRALYRDLREVLTQPFDLTEREQYRGTFLARLDTIALLHPLDPLKLRVVKQALVRNRDQYLTCLTHRGVPADNNKAERALRHLVLKRKNSFGSKTAKGAETTGILTSVLLSLYWSKPTDFFTSYRELRGV